METGCDECGCLDFYMDEDSILIEKKLHLSVICAQCKHKTEYLPLAD